MTVEAVALVAAKFGVKTALGMALKKLYARLITPNDPKFLEAKEEMFETWTVELAQASAGVATEMAQLAEVVHDIREKLEQRAEDHEASAVLQKYGDQAYQEPIDERRRMLAFAAAGIIDVRLTVAEHARVQRRLDELEPDDVVALYGLSRTFGRVWRGKMYPNDSAMRYALWDDLPNGEALVAAGCLRTEAAGGGAGVGARNELTLTNFGRLVLQVLRAYCQTRKVPFDVPGREVTPEMRSEDEARKVLAAIPGLTDAFLVAARKYQRLRYSPPSAVSLGGEAGPGAMSYGPPPAKGASWIEVFRMAHADATQLASFAPYAKDRDDVMHGRPRETIAVEAVALDDGSGSYVRVHGPHDVLRWLADDVGAPWY